jgi:DNA-binding CsgD family transcriptional regulator
LDSDTEHLALLGELAEYINRDNPGIEALCQFIVLRTFKHLGASSLFVSQLGSDAKIRTIGSFGLSEEMKQSWEVISIDDKLPVSDCIRTNQLYWLANNEDWLRDYPHLKKIQLDEETKTFIALPIKIKSSPMSMLGMTLHRQYLPNPIEITYLITVGGIFALQLSTELLSAHNGLQSNEEKAFNYLSRRQREILDRMADGLTNSEIATQLSFSDSTIRQETMRIYEIFQVAGRSEAVRKYRALKGK